MLLAAAALLVRSFDGLRAVDPGFSAEHTLVCPITLDNNAYDSGAKSREYYRRLGFADGELYQHRPAGPPLLKTSP